MTKIDDFEIDIDNLFPSLDQKASQLIPPQDVEPTGSSNAGSGSSVGDEPIFTHEADDSQAAFTMNINAVPPNLPREDDADPYWCQTCQKGFGARYMFNSHQRRHTRPFTCRSSLQSGNMCGKTFQYRKDLTRHSKTVHAADVEASQYFSCPHSSCDRSAGGKNRGFLRPDTLRRHLYNIHKEQSSSATSHGASDSWQTSERACPVSKSALTKPKAKAQSKAKPQTVTKFS